MARPRIVSLIASATEIVCALGYEDCLVGRSHECDYPPSVARLPVLSGPTFEVHGSSHQVHDALRATLAKGEPVYRIDQEKLHALQPDVIITQAHCDVCAVSDKDVAEVIGGQGCCPQVVVLSPHSLDDVWQSIETIAEAIGDADAGRRLTTNLRQRVEAVAAKAARLDRLPGVVCLDWLDPFMVAGDWMPGMVQLAGGRPVLTDPQRPARTITARELQSADPDFILALPCGFDLDRTERELTAVADAFAKHDLGVFRTGNVFALDGNQYFNRPGPRLVESLEIIAEILHPEVFSFGHCDRGWKKFRPVRRR